MMNGALVAAFSAFVLWLIAEGYAKNAGSAWNALTGAAAGHPSTSAFAPPSGVPQQGPGVPTGAGTPGTPLSYTPQPINYEGYQLAA